MSLYFSFKNDEQVTNRGGLTMSRTQLTHADFDTLLALASKARLELDHRAAAIANKVEGVDFMPGLRGIIRNEAIKLDGLLERLTICQVRAPRVQS